MVEINPIIILKLIIFSIVGFASAMFIFIFSGITSLILSEKLIEFLLVSSITGMGFGIVGLQLDESNIYKKELKAELIDIGIFMILSFLSGIVYLANKEFSIGDFNFGHISISFFILAITLFLLTLVFVKFNWYNKLVDLKYKK